MRKINNVISISTSIDGNFFKYWFEFLRPFHHLTNREIDVLAAFVKKRHELSKVISDSSVLDKAIFSADVRKEIVRDCGITSAYLQIIISKFKKKSIIKDGKLNPRYIPRINEEDDGCQLLLVFDFNGKT